ncbi:hypothetical protein [Hoeflea sp.]|uniref:hypothetical protein n=1 Tax=Hoeflea sp. TaxID=1940281 RepID=UPI003B522111
MTRFLQEGSGGLLPCRVIATLARAGALLLGLSLPGLLTGALLLSGDTEATGAYARDTGHLSTSRDW